MAPLPEIHFARDWSVSQSIPLRPGPVHVVYDAARLESQPGADGPPRVVDAFVDFGELGRQAHRWEVAAKPGAPAELAHDFQVPEGADHANLWFVDPERQLPDSDYGHNFQFRVAPAVPEPETYETAEYVRHPDEPQQPEALEKMVAGAKQAVRETYAPWLSKLPGEAVDVPGFRAMLESMHRTVVEQGYQGHLEFYPGQGPKAQAGKFYFNSDREPLVFKIPVDRVPDPQRFRSYPGHFGEPHPIEGVPERTPAENRGVDLSRGQILHHYRNANALPAFLERAAFLDDQLRRAVAEDRPAEALKLLSQYYHTCINAHFFRRVNNTLLMAQVNHVLHALGMVGIPHESLDYVALTNGEAEAPRSTRFRDFFLDAILARNPDGAALIAQARAL